jgi:hypothetical protein
MVSDTAPQHLTSENLAMLRGVLRDAGFEHAILPESERQFVAAASLLIKKFQEGLILRDELLLELELQFGKFQNTAAPKVAFMPQQAFQGLLVPGR